MRRIQLVASAILVGALALVLIGGATAKKPALSATPVFKLNLKLSQKAPPIKKADATGSVTFDLTRNAAGTIVSGEVIFYFNYSFPGAVTISGLHIHKGAKGVIGGIEVPAVLSAPDQAADADGHGNVTSVVAADPTKLQAILDNPRNYYVNLHTSVNLDGALREQMHNPKKR